MADEEHRVSYREILGVYETTLMSSSNMKIHKRAVMRTCVELPGVRLEYMVAWRAKSDGNWAPFVETYRGDDLKMALVQYNLGAEADPIICN